MANYRSYIREISYSKWLIWITSRYSTCTEYSQTTGKTRPGVHRTWDWGVDKCKSRFNWQEDTTVFYKRQKSSLSDNIMAFNYTIELRILLLCGSNVKSSEYIPTSHKMLLYECAYLACFVFLPLLPHMGIFSFCIKK